MDKKLIIKYLKDTFVNEASTPGIDILNKIKKQETKINKDGVKAIDKDVKSFDSKSKKNGEVKDNMFNYNTTPEQDFHNEVEIGNGQEKIRYDIDPPKRFKDRLKQSIEGSSVMGNEKGGNAEAAFGASSDNFGKDKLKTIKKGSDIDDVNRIPRLQLGNDVELMAPIGKKTKGKPTGLNESIGNDNYTHYALNKANNKIINGWNYKDIDKKELSSFKSDYFLTDLKDMGYNISDIKIVNKKYLSNHNINQNDVNCWDKKYSDSTITPGSEDLNKGYEKDSRGVEFGVNENKNNYKTQTKESMKRLKFKNQFGGLRNAIKLIPENYKVDNKEFEMTDGNENYRLRWEGTITEGKAVILLASNKKELTEDLQRMKDLFNYKSDKTFGNLKGKSRLDEEKMFNKILNKSKSLLSESDNIEGTKPEKVGEFDKTNIKQAPEAKKEVVGSVSQKKDGTAPKPKTTSLEALDSAVSVAPEATEHVEGSVSQKKDGTAPEPKKDDLKKSGVNQAPEAKKHVHLKENDELGDDDDDETETDVETDVETDDDSSIAPDDSQATPEDLPIQSSDDEDDIKVPVSKEVKLVVSKSNGKHFLLKKNGNPIEIDEKYVAIAKKYGAVKALAIYMEDLENEEPQPEPEELDEYGNEHPIQTDDAIKNIKPKK